MGFAEDVNYFFKSNLAYTEDNIVVYNLFFYRMPRSVSQNAIQDYFSKFGTILKVYLVCDKKRKRKCGPNVGFVNFLDPVSAANALLESSHIINGKRFMVKACDSWHQPGASGGEVNDDSSDTNDFSRLLDLNDDCLISICTHLPLSDQVHLARVCSRLRDIFSITCKSMYSHFNVDQLQGLTLWDIREFFHSIGPHIKTLKGSVPFKNRERILELLCIYCINVKNIQFSLFKIRTKCLRNLVSKMPNLTELKLRDCSLNDTSILAIQKSKNLIKLDLSDNFEITGKNLCGLSSKLTELNLYGCSNVQPTFFTQVCHSLYKLRVLNIQRCERINHQAFVEMCRYLQDLEVLKISTVHIPYELIAQMPKLKQFEFLMVSPTVGIPLQLFQDFVTYASKRLTHMKLVGKNCLTMERSQKIAQIQSLQSLVCICNEQANDDCLRQLAYLTNLEKLTIKEAHLITNAGVLHLIRSCEKLRHLNIQMCSEINEHFIFDTLQFLNKRKSQGTLEIIATQTGIHPSIVNNCLYLEAAEKGLIKLYFQVPHALELEHDEVGDSMLFDMGMDYLGDDIDDDIDDFEYLSDENVSDNDYYEFDDDFYLQFPEHFHPQDGFNLLNGFFLG